MRVTLSQANNNRLIAPMQTFGFFGFIAEQRSSLKLIVDDFEDKFKELTDNQLEVELVQHLVVL